MPPCVCKVLPKNPYTGSTFLSAIRYADGSCTVVVGAAGVVGVVVVVVSSSSSSSSTTISPSSSSSVTVSSSKRGRLNCPKASCMVIVPPNPRLDGNNKRTPKLMAAIAALYLSPKKENWSVIITTNLESLILI